MENKENIGDCGSCQEDTVANLKGSHWLVWRNREKNGPGVALAGHVLQVNRDILSVLPTGFL